MEPVRQLDLSLIQYAAGFIDGEGCLTLVYHNPRGGYSPEFRALLAVVNVDPRPLKALQKAFGGTVCLDKARAPGTNRRPYHHWQISGQGLQALLPHLAPHLIVKREQAALLLEYFLFRESLPPSCVRRTQEQLAVLATFVEEGHILNKRGLAAADTDHRRAVLHQVRERRKQHLKAATG